MKRALLTGILLSTIAMTLLPAPQANAQSTYSMQDTPLVVIRFNQRTVNYQQMLYSAVSRAVDASTSVRFNVVSYAPRGTDDADSDTLAATASARGQEVVRSLQSMGVPASRISQNSQDGSQSGYPEVRIFVQ